LSNFQNVFPYQAHSFTPNNTIEFRCPNGTLNPIIWQNNVNLFTKLLLFCKEESYQPEVVEAREKINNHKYMKLEWYDEIYLQQALEFSDLIFSNNLDKIYFLKQYLKSFEVRNRKDHYPKSIVFTKDKK